MNWRAILDHRCRRQRSHRALSASKYFRAPFADLQIFHFFLDSWVPDQCPQERTVSGLRYNNVIMRFVFLAVATKLALAGAASADEDVRAVQNKLRDDGFYSGEIDGAYSSALYA